jgi:hypothetical protein
MILEQHTKHIIEQLMELLFLFYIHMIVQVHISIFFELQMLKEILLFVYQYKNLKHHLHNLLTIKKPLRVMLVKNH